MDWFHFTVVCFFCIAASISHAAINSDYEDVASCLPKLADTCFSKLYKSIACHFDRRAPRNCTKQTAEEICSISSEALRCASDIINGDCSPVDGRDTFDNWMNGLTAVLDTFCEDNAMGVRSVIQTNMCWNLAEFVSCVNTSVGIGHVVDLMHKKLDLNICYKLAMGMTSCNARVARSTSCRNSFDVVDKSLHAFFTTTQCGVNCPTEKINTNGVRQKYFQESSQKKSSGKNLSSGAISTSVTIFVFFTWMCFTL